MDETLNLFGNSENLWKYINQYASNAGRAATRIVLQLFYVVKSPETPIWDKTIILAALGYQFLPEDLMSRDKYGLLGLFDNAITIAGAYSRVKARVTPEINNQVESILNQWFGQEDDTEIELKDNRVNTQNDEHVSLPQINEISVKRPVYNQNQSNSSSCRKNSTTFDDDVIID